ncbi:hypothetical protein DL98DRAFT_520285 [Cadophora sp. DSE1049]|nr:hypothetical protein DL98DRAFT_520285 [Cadophora sp. DSE1049]
MPTVGNFKELPHDASSDRSMKMASAEQFANVSLDCAPPSCITASPKFGEASGTEKAECFPLGRGSSFSQSVVESTDDGIMTPTVDDNHSETQTHQAPLLAANLEPMDDFNLPPSVMKANTHNIAFTDSQIPTIETFAADLQSAIDGAWPIRAEPQYNAVHVLMLSWEDGEPGLWADAQRLRHVFSNLYRFEVEDLRVPSASPQDLSRSKLSSFIRENSGGNNLLIVHQAGSALPSLDGRLLEETKSDVLLLCDSCYSPNISTRFPQGTTEVLAACGTDHQSPGVGPHSFTNILIRELEAAFIGPPISVAELHGRVLNTMDKLKPDLMRNTHGNLMTDENGRPRYETLVKRTPVHTFLTNGTARRSIMLSPLPAMNATGAVLGTKLTNVEDDWDVWGFSSKKSKRARRTQSKISPVAPAVPAVPVEPATKHPRVLLSVRLETNCFPDAESDEDSVWAWAEWLRDIPSGPDPVAIEAVYKKSSSTLMVVSMPFLVWHMLPSNPAYSFVGFVNSANLQDMPCKAAPQPVASSGVMHLECSEVKQPEANVRDIDIENEVRKRVEAEMAAKELAALRKEKEEWHRKLEIEKEAAMAKGMAMPNPFSNKRRDTDEVGRAKTPIRFKDAVGRKYSFPFHLAATWNGVEELIKQAFLHVDVLGPHVNEGHYDLMCSSGDLSGQIILPQVWETMVEPGWEVNMHMWPLPDPLKPMPPPPQRYPGPPKGPPLGPGVRAAPPPPPVPQAFNGPPPPPGQAVPWPSSGSARRREAPPPPLPPGGLHSPTPTASGKPWVHPTSTLPGISIVNRSKSKSSKQKSAPETTLPTVKDLDSDCDEAIIREGGPLTRSRRSSSSRSECGSEREYAERENAIALLKSMVSAKRIFVVGRVGTMGYGRRGLIEVRVKPKGEGMQLLNEYGKMFVEKVRTLKVEKGKMPMNTDEEEEVLLDD